MSSGTGSPAVSSTVYAGIVKSVFAEKGFGFIACEKTKAAFGRDVFVHHLQLGKFAVGDEVCFRVRVDPRGPKAQDLHAPGEAAPPAADGADASATAAGQARSAVHARGSAAAAGDRWVKPAADPWGAWKALKAFNDAKEVVQVAEGEAPDPLSALWEAKETKAGNEQGLQSGDAGQGDSTPSTAEDAFPPGSPVAPGTPSTAGGEGDVPNPPPAEPLRTELPLPPPRPRRDDAGGAASASAASASASASAPAPAEATQEAASSSPWQRYSLPATSAEETPGFWWWNEQTGEYFLEDSPGEWSQWSDPGGRQFWYKNDDCWFYCT
eukprot:TRINITY_DN2464_c3_g1_i1.p1 TRINITY_DN2464_c3_g1~~TRINITY_DN2464_c3_g1_i1.p1  ORF type:complete len:325 (-),score=72.40 TRINITY_DN2464_c3_g1_i1:11-985(-)